MLYRLICEAQHQNRPKASIATHTHQRCANADVLGRRERNAKVAALVVRPQCVVRHPIGQVRVQDGAQRQAVVPRRTEVGDVDVPVADRLVLAPLQQGVPFAAAVLHQRVQRILALAGCWRFGNWGWNCFGLDRLCVCVWMFREWELDNTICYRIGMNNLARPD